MSPRIVAPLSIGLPLAGAAALAYHRGRAPSRAVRAPSGTPATARQPPSAVALGGVRSTPPCSPAPLEPGRGRQSVQRQSQAGDGPRCVSSVELARLLTEHLSQGGKRYADIAKEAGSDANALNRPYPNAPGDTLPVEIRTTFKYARQPAQPLDDRTVVLLVQHEGGWHWGEEAPCHDELLLLRRDPAGQRYREVASYWTGSEQGMDGTQWSLVDSMRVNEDRTVTLNWWYASRYGAPGRYDRVSTVRVQGDDFVCIPPA